MGADQILTVAQMQAAEQGLIDAGIPVEELMQRAGAGAAQWIWRIAGRGAVTILCGPGNNGGDGYVIAEELRRRGARVTVIAAAAPATKAAQLARAAWQGRVTPPDAAGGGDVFVDCLFGSGLTRPVDNRWAALIAQLAATHRHSVAVDVPSNIASDDGQPLGPVPRYDLTVALGAWKYAHFTMPAAALMGRLALVEIGIGSRADAALVLDKPQLAAPAADAHKYTRGLLGIVTGTMPGAARLAAEAAMRAGAGYVRLLGPHSRDLALPAELVADERPLAEALSDGRYRALLVGPGLGRDIGAHKALGEALACGIPCVLDADALTLLDPEARQRAGSLILTPHEGELRKLEQAFALEHDARAPLHRRAATLASVSSALVVAKGPNTAIAAPGGGMRLAPRASPWLSVAGSGDVLAGIIASRLATAADPDQAAAQGVWLHGEAARLAGPAFTAGGLAGQVARAYAACL